MASGNEEEEHSRWSLCSARSALRCSSIAIDQLSHVEASLTGVRIRNERVSCALSSNTY